MSRDTRTGGPVRALAGLGVAAVVSMAVAMPVDAAAGAVAPLSGYAGGFSTEAVATPLRIEIYEPSIPIPSDPQAELNFSYTTVAGTSGPNSTARSSAMWPGDAVGEGLKTIVEQSGLPPQLGENGYPVQANAQYPSDTTHAEQEPLPGTVERVRTDDAGAVARAGYSSDGQVAGDDSGKDTSGTGGGGQGGSGSGGSPVPGLPGLPAVPGLPGIGGGGTGATGASGATASNPLSALAHGDLSALGGALTGSSVDSSSSSVRTADPAPSSPLGALGAVIAADGMSSSSRTDYGTAAGVSATAAASLGELRLAGGIVTLTGMRVTAVTTATAAGATATPRVSYGEVSIAGTPFALTSDGFEAAGNKTAIPGLPDAPAKALKMLGIAIELPKPEKTVTGTAATLVASGPRITFDTGVLRSKLPSLPIGQITKSLPDSAGQLKSLLLALNEAHPKFVIYPGRVSSTAQTVKGISFAPPQVPAGGSATGGSAPAAAGTASGGAGPAPSGAGAGLGATPAGGAATGDAAPAATPVQNVSATPGLPPLGSVPGMLTIGGIALAAGAGWWFRRGMGLLFGGAGTCPHGLASGLPDLRKV